MAVGTPRQFAQCEPISPLRDRLLADLNIKGVVACPDKVNVEAIQPVYDMSDSTRQTLVSVQPALGQPIGGSPAADVFIYLCNAIGNNLSFEELNYFFVSVEMDDVDRLAFVAAGQEARVHLRFLDAEAGVYLELGNAAWLPANPTVPGDPLTMICGTHIRSLGAAGTRFPAANLFEFVLPSPLKLKHTRGGYLNCYIETTLGNWPVSTVVIVNAIYSYK